MDWCIEKGVVVLSLAFLNEINNSSLSGAAEWYFCERLMLSHKDNERRRMAGFKSPQNENLLRIREKVKSSHSEARSICGVFNRYGTVVYRM
eukprot:scaffold90767_cov63-Cyclotella_meneghiniana.AAC.6